MKVKVAQSCPALCNPMDYTAHGILQVRYWSGKSFLFPGNLPNSGVEPRSPTLQVPLLSAIIIKLLFIYYIPVNQFSSVAQSCLTLCDPMNLSTPGLPVHHQLPEFTQTHAHQVGDAIQPSHPLSSSSPPALNPSQHQGLLE